MRRSYLGKLALHWCDHCHVPVLGSRCACGAETRPVPITPPGDIRPAFDADIRHINAIWGEYFGSGLIPDGHLVLLNKIPDADRMEEIILGGSVVSAIRYIADEERWEPIPRRAAAAFMQPSKQRVIVDRGAVESIRQGSSVLAPGLVGMDDGIGEGDEVFIFDEDGQCVGVGRAKAGTEDARTMQRGMIVRTRKNVPSLCIPGRASWDDAVEANRTILDRVEAEAVRFVCDVAAKNPLPANVSYSGGKDSLATLLIVRKAIGDIPLLFADTGLEFAETYRNIEEVASAYGLEVIRTGSADAFWEAFAREGPPAVDKRWCCKACKLLPVRDLITEQWGECLSFIGQRKYESFARKNSPRVWRNGVVGCQLSAAPIQHWTALHVWLYLFREHAPYNALYEQRIDRIGCYLCPSSDMAVFATIREEFPDLWADWQARLVWWQTAHDLPGEWIEKGLWRRIGESADEDSSYS
ncbi:MAG TPA: phosphoadenosine phosphosulfate reductase [Methanoculleus sp.]|nr:phosphoadenosine phosphosulfate reductase [Methanoculleus sp.]